MESKDGAGWVVQNSDRSMDEEIRNIGPCLCGDYGPHQGCVDSEHWNVMGTGIFIPNPVCICGHPLNWHGSDGCNHDIQGESEGPESTESCPCLCFDDRSQDGEATRCVRCGEEVDPGKVRCAICDERFMRSNEGR